jgi:hypothetical protein
LGNNSKIVNNIRNLTWSKNDQHSKIYLPCNFEVNLITHLGIIAFFSSNFLNFNTFRLIFQKLSEIKVKFKFQNCGACQDLPALQFLSKSPIPLWSYFLFFIKFSKFLYFLSFISKTIRDRC